MELSEKELALINLLRAVMVHHWGSVEVKVQDGAIWGIELHLHYRGEEIIEKGPKLAKALSN